jgi:hypothetical protein
LLISLKKFLINHAFTAEITLKVKIGMIITKIIKIDKPPRVKTSIPFPGKKGNMIMVKKT